MKKKRKYAIKLTPQKERSPIYYGKDTKRNYKPFPKTSKGVFKMSYPI